MEDTEQTFPETVLENFNLAKAYNSVSEGNFFNIDIETLFNIASILQLYIHVFESYLIDENDPKYEALREFVLETLGKFSCKIKKVGIKLENL